jgi:hypothetical protein
LETDVSADLESARNLPTEEQPAGKEEKKEVE